MLLRVGVVACDSGFGQLCYADNRENIALGGTLESSKGIFNQGWHLSPFSQLEFLKNKAGLCITQQHEHLSAQRM